jgi:hypothetical protein
MKASAIKLGIMLIIAPSAGRDKRDDACNIRLFTTCDAS